MKGCYRFTWSKRYSNLMTDILINYSHLIYVGTDGPRGAKGEKGAQVCVLTIRFLVRVFK